MEGILQANKLVFVTVSTGYYGEDEADIYFLEKGCNVSELVQECALQNAQMYGSDGEYICPECGSQFHYWDDYCENCDCDCEWVENDMLSGYACVLDVSHLGSVCNSGLLLFDILKDVGVLKIKIEDGIATVQTSELQKLMTGSISGIDPYLVSAILHPRLSVLELKGIHYV